MNFAYMRVSTKDKQEFIRQEFVLKDYKIDKVFEEKISGTKKACGRQEFEKMLKELKAGDTVYFESMSRMARSVQDLIETTDLLAHKMKVKVVFIKENLSVGGNGLDAMGALLFNVMSAFAQFERDIIADRTKQALQARKAAGVALGRKKSDNYDEQVAEIKKCLKNGYTAREIWENREELGITYGRSHVYELVKNIGGSK